MAHAKGQHPPDSAPDTPRRSFLGVFRYSRTPINVFRVIMANPMTTIATLESILLEQSELAKGERTQALLTSIYKLDDA